MHVFAVHVCLYVCVCMYKHSVCVYIYFLEELHYMDLCC